MLLWGFTNHLSKVFIVHVPRIPWRAVEDGDLSNVDSGLEPACINLLFRPATRSILERLSPCHPPRSSALVPELPTNTALVHVHLHTHREWVHTVGTTWHTGTFSLLNVGLQNDSLGENPLFRHCRLGRSWLVHHLSP